MGSRASSFACLSSLCVSLLWSSELLRVGGAEASCRLPALAIGPRMNSSKDLTRLVKKHRFVLVGFSATSCAHCCAMEPIYEELLSLLPKNVHWARVDLDRVEARGLAATHDIDALPAVIFFKHRKPIPLLEMQRLATLSAFVERSLAPIPTAGTDDALWTSWRNLTSVAGSSDGSYGFLEQIVRVAAISKSDDEDALEEITNAAEAFVGRPSSFRFLRLKEAKAQKELMDDTLVQRSCGGLVKQDNALVALSLFDGEFVELTRIRREVNGPRGVGVLVPHASLASGIIFNRSTTVILGSTHATELTRLTVLPRVSCRSLNANDNIAVEQWVLRASLPPVGRFDTMTSSLYEKTMKPFLMLFVDLARPEMVTWLKLMHDAQKFHNDASREEKDGLKLMFVYVDGLQYLHRMTSVGLVADPERLPAVGINFVTSQYLTWQPSREEYVNGTARLTGEVLSSLVHGFLHGDTRNLIEGDTQEALPVPQRDATKGQERSIKDLGQSSLEDRLRYVQAVNADTFDEVVFDSTRDVAVFFYASAGAAQKACLDVAIYINRCRERFDELGLATVRLAKLDTSMFSAPSSVQIPSVPSILLFPAFSKDAPHPVFHGKFRVQSIMWWIQDHASRAFKLPELPHLDEIETKAYWEQKGQMDKEKQKEATRIHERRPRRKKPKAEL